MIKNVSEMKQISKWFIFRSKMILCIVLLILLLTVSSCSKSGLVIEPEFDVTSLNSTNTTGSRFGDFISNNEEINDVEKYINDTDFKDLKEETQKFISSKALASYEPNYAEDFLENG